MIVLNPCWHIMMSLRHSRFSSTLRMVHTTKGATIKHESVDVCPHCGSPYSDRSESVEQRWGLKGVSYQCDSKHNERLCLMSMYTVYLYPSHFVKMNQEAWNVSCFEELCSGQFMWSKLNYYYYYYYYFLN